MMPRSHTHSSCQRSNVDKVEAHAQQSRNNCLHLISDHFGATALFLIFLWRHAWADKRARMDGVYCVLLTLSARPRGSTDWYCIRKRRLRSKARHPYLRNKILLLPPKYVLHYFIYLFHMHHTPLRPCLGSFFNFNGRVSRLVGRIGAYTLEDTVA